MKDFAARFSRKEDKAIAERLARFSALAADFERLGAESELAAALAHAVILRQMELNAAIAKAEGKA